MIPMWQLVIGIGFGLVTAFFLKRQQLTYSHSNDQRDREREDRAGDFDGPRPRNHGAGANGSARFNSKPGDSCVICLDQMHNNDMTYMRCGHALHDQCYQSCRRHTKQCPICRMAL